MPAMSLIRHVLLLAGLSAAASVAAADFYEERGGWEIGAGDTGCALSMDYEGPGATSVMLLDDLDNGLFLIVANYGWSSKEREKYNISLALDADIYGGASAIGARHRSRNGFLIKLDPEFKRDFAKGSSLHVYLDDRLIDRLSLAGTGVALASLERCMALVRRERSAEEREKRRWADLPTDPFSGPAALADGKAQAPEPRVSPANWASSFDYPTAALRSGVEGIVRFTLAVGADGTVNSCEVTQSSGNADLDATTCTLMMRRARMKPATDPAGLPIEGRWSSSVRWEIPEPPPPPPAPVTCVAGQVCTRPQ